VTIDWDRLERELAGEPAPRRWSLRARRVRSMPRPRRGALVTALLAVLTLGLAAGLVVGAARLLASDPGRIGGGRISPARATSSARPGVAGRPTGVSTRAEICAAALGAAGIRRPLRRTVWVRTTICASVPTSPASAACDDGRIPAGVRRAVRRLLGPRVRFAADPVTPPRPGRGGLVAVVQFGRLRLHGASAELGVETVCAALCGEGERLRLRRHDGRWQVAATVGPRWVS